MFCTSMDAFQGFLRATLLSSAAGDKRFRVSGNILEFRPCTGLDQVTMPSLPVASCRNRSWPQACPGKQDRKHIACRRGHGSDIGPHMPAGPVHPFEGGRGILAQPVALIEDDAAMIRLYKSLTEPAPNCGRRCNKCSSDERLSMFAAY